MKTPFPISEAWLAIGRLSVRNEVLTLALVQIAEAYPPPHPAGILALAALKVSSEVETEG